MPGVWRVELFRGAGSQRCLHEAIALPRLTQRISHDLCLDIGRYHCACKHESSLIVGGGEVGYRLAGLESSGQHVDEDMYDNT